jgi:NADPH:quinone reductase-like Zn-dependent oxidoreductase
MSRISDEQIAPLPDPASFEAGATLGIPAMTAWAATCAEGDIAGKTVLVTGGAGAVGRFAVADGASDRRREGDRDGQFRREGAPM